MGPQQINDLFLSLVRRTATAGGNTPEPTQQPPAPKAEPLNYKELLDPNHDNYNPEAALKGFVEANYGSLIGDINKRSVKGMFGNYRQQIHDFGDYEADIEKALEGRDPATLTDKDVIGSYFTLKGHKQFMTERADRAKQAGSSTHPPSPGQSNEGAPVELDDEAREVAKVMFGNKTDPEGEYKKWKEKSDQGPMTLKVPVGGGKTE